MTLEVTFRAVYPWALLPYAQRVETREADADSAIYDQNFRWMRRKPGLESRAAWRSAEELGWITPSPIDIRMTPLFDAEIEAPDPELAQFRESVGLTNFWQRTNNSIMANEPAPWLKFCEFAQEDQWSNMFVPLGQGYVEWRLGWELVMPPECHAALLPLKEPDGLEVAMGILSNKNAERANQDRLGLSLSIRPLKPIWIQRGDPLARIVILHPDSLKSKALLICKE